MFRYFSVHNRIPNRFFCTFSNPNTRSPPRKGRQAVRRISKLLSSQIQNPNLSETLKTLESSPETLSSSQASTLITAISNPLISFDFYRFLRSSRPIFKPDSILFASLIKSQLQSVNPFLPRIKYFFDEMKKQKISLSTDDLNSFFDLVVPNYAEIAGFLITEVLEKNVFDEGCYSYAISVYVKHRLSKDAILLAERARMRCRKPSLGLYSSVMDVYRVNGDVKSAMKLFYEMEENGVLADEGIYRVLLGILCRAGRVKFCWVLLEEMRRVGYKPDEALGKDLIGLFMKQGMNSEVECLLKQGILKDEESLGVFVETMVEKGKPLVALELVKNMKESGVVVDGCVYASLICGCGKMGLVDSAEEIFAEIKTLEAVKNQEMVYSAMVYVYARAEMKEMAEMILNEMETRKGFKLSGKEFLFMMSMYGELGLVGDVVRMFDHWKQSGCLLSVDAYSVLLDALSKSGKLNQARDFLLEMRSFGMQPSSLIYSSMIEAYLQVGLINHAIALFDEYKILGLKLDEVIARSILRVLIQANRYLELGCYLDKFRRQGIKISRDNATLLLEMCKDDSCFRKLNQLLQ